MGMFVEALSHLVYGVVCSIDGLSWPFLIQRLKEIGGETTESGNEIQSDASISQESKKKIAKLEKNPFSVFFSAQEVRKMDKDDNDDDDDDDCEECMGDFELCNFLEKNANKIEDAVKAAFDKVLGTGHNLTLKVYIGHEEDSANFLLMLESTEAKFTSNADRYEGVCSCKVLPRLPDESKTSAMIKKAVSTFGIDVDTEEDEGVDPTWRLVTECQFHR